MTPTPHHTTKIVPGELSRVLPERRVCFTASSKSPTRPSVCLCIYFIFQSQTVWCNCSKDPIWYFGFFFFFFWGGLDKFHAPSSVWDGMAAYGECACSTRLWPQSFLVQYQQWKRQNRNIYIQFASVPKMLQTSLSAHSVYLRSCVSTYLCALQINLLVRLLFVILFCTSVCVGTCVYSVSKLEGCN